MNRVREYLQRLGGRRSEQPVSWPRFKVVAGRGEVELAVEVETYVCTLKNVLVGVRVFRDRLESEQRHCRDALAQLGHNAHQRPPERRGAVLDYVDAARSYVYLLESVATGILDRNDKALEVSAEQYELARRVFIGKTDM